MLRFLWVLAAAVVLPVQARAALIDFSAPALETRGADAVYDVSEDFVSFTGSTTTDPTYVVPGTDIFNPVAQLTIDFVVREATFASFFGTAQYGPEVSNAWFDIYSQDSGVHVVTILGAAPGAHAIHQALDPGTYLLFASVQSLSAESPASLSFTFSGQPIPEPSSIVLGLIGGALVVAAYLRHRRTRSRPSAGSTP